MLQKIFDTAKSTLIKVVPALNVANAAKEMISEAVAQKIRAAADEKGKALMAQAHRNVVINVCAQNGALIASLVPVYFLQSAWPFYLAYAVVLGFNVLSMWRQRLVIGHLIEHRSLTATLAAEIHKAIEEELTQREFYERKAVEWLGPDLRALSVDIARKMRPDVIAAGINIGFTMLVSSVAFRIFIIPMLERQALHGG